MPDRVTAQQREAVVELLAQGHDRDTIAARVGLTPGQVSAVAAHIKMGTYRPSPHDRTPTGGTVLSDASPSALDKVSECGGRVSSKPQFLSIPIGLDVEENQEVLWNPCPISGSANPHVLILGESGFGKTYTVSCLLAELVHRHIPTIVLDYGQGFSPTSAPPDFARVANPISIRASRDGININPMQIFPSDIHGPLNVAQRVADTFARVYPQLGVQQHSVLRQAVVDAFEDVGILSDDHESWNRPLPDFVALSHKLEVYAAKLSFPQRAVAASVASHISSVFVFNTFRRSGSDVSWQQMLNSDGTTHIMELHGLEHSLERIVTEFILWNLLGFAEALGPGPLRVFVVLDEAHKLSFARASPVEKLLREGRKFGIGVILASQQPEDFSSVAFANTATKIIFQVGDERSAVSRQLHRKVRSHSFAQIFDIITKLPQAYAYVVTENVGRVVRVDSLETRSGRWGA